MKIQFNHNEDSLSGSLNLPQGRIIEIKDSIFDRATKDNTTWSTKSELIEQVIDDLNLIKPAELFVLGTIFGVMDYIQVKKDNDSGEFKEQMQDAIMNMEAGRSPILKLDKFKKEMRNGEQEF